MKSLMQNNAIINENSITMMVNGITKTVSNGHVNFLKIKEALKVKDFDLAAKLIDVVTSINLYGKGKVKVSGNEIHYNGKAIHNELTRRIMNMMSEGFDVSYMLLFLENLMDNPSYRAVNELYGFLQSTKLPITEDGHFLAYKKVRKDYKDIYSGNFDNSIGSEPSMDRNEVNEDKDVTCSKGLHFCSMSYLPQYGGSNTRVMIVKVNPRDVVSIPSDYNNAKGRACRYQVVGEVDADKVVTQKEEPFVKSVHNTNDFNDAYKSGQEFGSMVADDHYIDDETANNVKHTMMYCEDDVFDTDMYCDEDEYKSSYESNKEQFKKGFTAGFLEKWDDYDGEELDDSGLEYDPEYAYTKEEAIDHLHITRNALNKRIQRGTLSTIVVNGETLVVLNDPKERTKDDYVVDYWGNTHKKDELFTEEQMMNHLGITKNALNRRVDRGYSVRRVQVGDDVFYTQNF